MKAQFKPGKIVSSVWHVNCKAKSNAKFVPATTEKMQRIQATKSSFKFRLGAMLALRPISSVFHVKQ